MSEAAARHKIDQLLKNAGWRFFGDDNGPANIRLEAHVALKRDDLDSLGDDFERSGRGFVDFLLIDDRGFPLVVLEAKSEDKNPLVGKEQARRVLFLVDRLELEDQAANKSFVPYLANDFDAVIYKEKRDDWRRAHIVVTTVQSLLFNNKYQSLFSPTDFDLVISDEAHRSIIGNARAVFDYFVGYKLGLTATPRDYLRGGPHVRDPREVERRLLLDTYRTFGCESGEPTFRYSLLDGVRDGYLINPRVVDARTEVTTQLLADEGFVVSFTDAEVEQQEEAFK